MTNKSMLLKKQKITLIVMASLLAVLFICLFALIIASINKDDSDDDKNDDSSINISDMEFEDMEINRGQTQSGTLILVNHDHEYVFPTDPSLVNIAEYKAEKKEQDSNSYYQLAVNTLMLDSEAMENLHAMTKAYFDETGKSHLNITAAYRTLADQEGRTPAPGFSDHHTGLLVALKIIEHGTTYELTDPDYESVYKWICDNAHKYGFIMRYPEEKSSVTNVNSYTHAFRYVGVAHATYIKENNLCLEEYIEQLGTVTFKKPLEIKGGDGNSYFVYHYECDGETTEIKVPKNADYTVSGTNDGGVVVTVKNNSN